MTSPWFLERLTAADWRAMGVSTHRQLVLTVEERIRSVGINRIVGHVAADASSHLQAEIRHQVVGYLAESDWDAATASNTA